MLDNNQKKEITIEQIAIIVTLFLGFVNMRVNYYIYESKTDVKAKDFHLNERKSAYSEIRKFVAKMVVNSEDGIAPEEYILISQEAKILEYEKFMHMGIIYPLLAS